AQGVADRYAAQTGDVINKLLGDGSGQTLRANQLVRTADNDFQDLLVLAYKMTRAFVHRYNFADTAEGWTNKVYRSLTLTDVQALRDALTNAEQGYCGMQGADCDTGNNRQVFRFSMREQLFPGLKDIVDPNSGRVLFAGEQFHNLITSS